MSPACPLLSPFLPPLFIGLSACHDLCGRYGKYYDMYSQKVPYLVIPGIY
jgi:hypothetical protein